MRRRRALIGAAIAAAAILGVTGLRFFHRAPPLARHDAERLDLAPSELEVDASQRIVGVVRGPAPHEWCVKLSASNARAIESHLTADAGCVTPTLECVVDDAGVGWGFEVIDAGAEVDHDECITSTNVDLVRGDGVGLTRSPGDAGLTLTQEGSRGFQWATEELAIRALSDYDGDGDQEVLVTRRYWAHEGERGAESSVWTRKNGALERYAPASGFVIDDVVDADHDGKLDLVTRGPYDKIRAWAAIGFWNYSSGPSIFLAHALPNGTFSMTDPVAVAFTKAKCAAATEKNETMACERLRGKTESAVLAAEKQAGCVDFLGDAQRYPQSCPTWMPDLAAVSPPFRF